MATMITLGPEPLHTPPLRVSRSRHAQVRQHQRGVRDAALDYVLDYGTPIHRTGVTFVVLRWRDIPPVDRKQDRWTRLVGTVVVVGEHGRIVTTYRNHDALGDIRRKHKFSQRRYRVGGIA